MLIAFHLVLSVFLPLATAFFPFWPGCSQQMCEHMKDTSNRIESVFVDYRTGEERIKIWDGNVSFEIAITTDFEAECVGTEDLREYQICYFCELFFNIYLISNRKDLSDTRMLCLYACCDGEDRQYLMFDVDSQDYMSETVLFKSQQMQFLIMTYDSWFADPSRANLFQVGNDRWRVLRFETSEILEIPTNHYFFLRQDKDLIIGCSSLENKAPESCGPEVGTPLGPHGFIRDGHFYMINSDTHSVSRFDAKKLVEWFRNDTLESFQAPVETVSVEQFFCTFHFPILFMFFLAPVVLLVCCLLMCLVRRKSTRKGAKRLHSTSTTTSKKMSSLRQPNRSTTKTTNTKSTLTTIRKPSELSKRRKRKSTIKN